MRNYPILLKCEEQDILMLLNGSYDQTRHIRINVLARTYLQSRDYIKADSPAREEIYVDARSRKSGCGPFTSFGDDRTYHRRCFRALW